MIGIPLVLCFVPLTDKMFVATQYQFSLMLCKKYEDTGNK